MTLPLWREEPIDRRHDRSAFDCGVGDLNDYLQRYARQNHRLGGAKTFVAVPQSSRDKILGFYTLSPASLTYADTPATVAKGLAKHDVPVFRLGRLAVDRSSQGLGLGGALLMSAGRRCLAVAEQVGGVALLIDAKDDSAARWYAGFGAVPLIDRPLSLVIPMMTLRNALVAS